MLDMPELHIGNVCEHYLHYSWTLVLGWDKKYEDDLMYKIMRYSWNRKSKVRGWKINEKDIGVFHN